MNQFDIISQYFRSSVSTPDGSSIAAPAVLSQLTPNAANQVGGLHIIPLTAPERTAFQNKDPTNQRRATRAMLRLIRRRPHLATRAGVDPATYEEIAAKDEAFDVLFGVMGELQERVSQGLLVIRASLSQRTITVVSYLRQLMSDPQADPAEVQVARVNFAGVNASALRLLNCSDAKSLRKKGQRGVGQPKVTELQGDRKVQDRVGLFTEDSKKSHPALGDK